MLVAISYINTHSCNSSKTELLKLEIYFKEKNKILRTPESISINSSLKKILFES